MRINKPKTQRPRTEPVKFGGGQGGHRQLVRSVMEAGFSQRTAAKAVNTVIGMWIQAIKDHDQWIDMPIGYIKVKKTPKHLYKKRYTKRVIGNNHVGRLISWTIYNDRYRIIWRVPEAEWQQLLADLNENSA